MRAEITCPPYDFDSDCQMPAPATISILAAHALAMSNRYRAAMESRADLRTTFRAARALADATEALTTAIADALATHDDTDVLNTVVS